MDQARQEEYVRLKAKFEQINNPKRNKFKEGVQEFNQHMMQTIKQVTDKKVQEQDKATLFNVYVAKPSTTI
jgi:hypothetical protein